MAKPNDFSSVANVPILILAGGLGTRLAEETTVKPKPMVEIGGLPILIHIMRGYYQHGFNDFVICGGHKVNEIKKFFVDYQFNIHDLELDTRTQAGGMPRAISTGAAEERWRVRVLDTGAETMTGGRVARAFDIISRDQKVENFAVTYGDGLSDVDLAAELRFHTKHKALGTVLGVKNLARYGELDIQNEEEVTGFLEKPQDRQGYISGGFFFFNAKFRKYLDPRTDLYLEREPLMKLASDGQLKVFKHGGFWAPMDTLRDKIHLQSLWDNGQAPWATWRNTNANDTVSDRSDRAAWRRAG